MSWKKETIKELAIFSGFRYLQKHPEKKKEFYFRIDQLNKKIIKLENKCSVLKKNVAIKPVGVLEKYYKTGQSKIFTGDSKEFSRYILALQQMDNFDERVMILENINYKQNEKK